MAVKKATKKVEKEEVVIEQNVENTTEATEEQVENTSVDTSTEDAVEAEKETTEEQKDSVPEVTVDTTPAEPEVEVDTDKAKVDNSKKPNTTVKIRMRIDHKCTIAGEFYDLKKGKTYTVPQNVKRILNKAGYLIPLA